MVLPREFGSQGSLRRPGCRSERTLRPKVQPRDFARIKLGSEAPHPEGVGRRRMTAAVAITEVFVWQSTPPEALIPRGAGLVVSTLTGTFSRNIPMLVEP
jgi:hypothetical protein